MVMDMDVDYGFRLTGDGSSDQSYASVVDYVTSRTNDGFAPESFEKTVSDGSSPVGDAIGGHYAYVDASDLSAANTNDTGWEFAIPFSEINATSKSQFQLFAAYGNVDGSGDGQLSAHIVPDDGQSTYYPGNEDWTGVSNTQATGETELPVEFASFNARKSGSDAVLSWTTASETNNSGFAVQHAAADGSFEKAGWVDGAGTTTEAQDYRFSLEGLSAGTHRFRLKQVDLDGTTSFSETVRLTVQPEGPVSVQAAPHPVQQASTVRITAKESGPVSVALYDVLGRRVETLHEGRVAANQPETFDMNAASLSAGTYFLRVEGDTFTETKRITVAQ